MLKKFDNPIYVTRPLLPPLEVVTKKLQEIWDAKWLTNNGAQHQLLEAYITQYLNIPALSLFNNGTIALIVACQSLRISGEVITTPFTFPATPHVLTWNNIKPIFCDIDPHSLNIDANKIEAMITPETTAILAVHVFGNPCDVFKIQEIADYYGLKVIYDAAHAFGTEIDNIGIGQFGDISMFSFHATKLFHTVEGGALAFKDTNLKPRIDLLKNFGIKNEEMVMMPGINGKMNEMQAAVGLCVLDCLAEERQKRKQLLEVYHQHLKKIPGIYFTQVPDINVTQQSYQYFCIRINAQEFGKSRNEVYDILKTCNIFVRKYFYPLCSDYPCYKQLPSAHKDNLPIANQIADEILALPFYGELPVADVEQICHNIAIIHQNN